MNLSKKGVKSHTYEAIVIGSGITGGWAAKELTEGGLDTLLLERGRDVKHGDYPTAFSEAWDFEGRTEISQKQRARKPKQTRAAQATWPSTYHWFADDIDVPYQEKHRFDWIRGYHVGGRSLMWGRQCYRWSDIDFEANRKEGVGVDWPIRYTDIESWYTYVERFVGISGQSENLPHLPDSKFLPPVELNCVEAYARETLLKKYPDRLITPARVANLTVPHKGRGPCQNRNRCMRGCPFGGYFSSNSATLPAAFATGRLTLRPFSIVAEIIYDEESEKAKGVRVIDSNTNEQFEYFANVIFLCASTVHSTAILLNSRSLRFPNGLGNDSGELGHNLMDHHSRIGAKGVTRNFSDKFYRGFRPTGFYIPRFRNLDEKSHRKDYVRGFGYQGSASREDWTRGIAELSNYGSDFKEQITKPGHWTFGINAFGEMLPHHDNCISIDPNQTDKWGQPTITFNCRFRENETSMRQDMQSSAAEILETCGFEEIEVYDESPAPGRCIHEMGTARMGNDPDTSVLNKWNQLHSVPNLYVTDGSCMTSSSCVNPSLTYMALTARASQHALKAIKDNFKPSKSSDEAKS